MFYDNINLGRALTLDIGDGNGMDKGGRLPDDCCHKPTENNEPKSK